LCNYDALYEVLEEKKSLYHLNTDFDAFSLVVFKNKTSNRYTEIGLKSAKAA